MTVATLMGTGNPISSHITRHNTGLMVSFLFIDFCVISQSLLRRIVSFYLAIRAYLSAIAFVFHNDLHVHKPFLLLVYIASTISLCSCYFPSLSHFDLYQERTWNHDCHSLHVQLSIKITNIVGFRTIASA